MPLWLVACDYPFPPIFSTVLGRILTLADTTPIPSGLSPNQQRGNLSQGHRRGGVGPEVPKMAKIWRCTLTSLLVVKGGSLDLSQSN